MVTIQKTIDNMEFKGILVKKIGQREGDNARGHWVIAQFLLEQEGMYPKRMACDVMNSEFVNTIGKFESMIGKRVVVRFDIDANEGNNGKWYNNIRGYDIREDISDEEREKRANEKKVARKSELGTIETPEGKVDVNEAGSEVPPKVEGTVDPVGASDGEKDDDLPF